MRCSARMKPSGWLRWPSKGFGMSGFRDVGQIWRQVQARLEAASEVGPKEGKALVAEVTGLGELGLVLGEHDPFPDDKMDMLEKLVRRRLAGEPLAQVLGFAWFYGRKWRVTPEVLIPRPDTEVLVTEVLERLQRGDYVAEVGVGSGCIIGTIVAERDDVTALGVEISEQAAAVARANVQALGIDAGRWEIVVSDGLDGIENKFNMIVSNPPYVTDNEWNKLDREVRDFEPKLALTGGVANPDGLVFYRRLAAWGRDKVAADGWLCMETGWQQAQAVRKLLQEQGDVWCEISVTKDLGGRERVVCAKRC